VPLQKRILVFPLIPAAIAADNKLAAEPVFDNNNFGLDT
jgi:hypothetical protein